MASILLVILLVVAGSPADEINAGGCQINNLDTVLVLAPDIVLVHFSFDDPFTVVVFVGCNGAEFTPTSLSFVEL